MHVCECVFELVKAHGHCDCCEAMHACACLCMNKARTHMGLLRGDACMCASVFGLQRRTVTAIAVRQCMHLWECMFGLAQGTCAH